MAVEATGSRHSRTNALLFAAVCLGLALWFFHDGYLDWFGDYRQKQLEKGGGKPTPNLWFNMVAPFPLALVALYQLMQYVRIPGRRLISDDNGLTLHNGQTITYADMTYIDQRKFKDKGVVTLGYKDGGQQKEVTFSSGRYDNLPALLDELVARTGAKPESQVDQDPAAEASNTPDTSA